MGIEKNKPLTKIISTGHYAHDWKYRKQDNPVSCPELHVLLHEALETLYRSHSECPLIPYMLASHSRLEVEESRYVHPAPRRATRVDAEARREFLWTVSFNVL